MRKKTNKFSIGKTRRRAILVASIALGITVGGLGIKAALDTNEDASAAINANLLSKKMVDINPLYEQYLEDLENGEGDKWELVPSKYIPAADESEDLINETSNGTKRVNDAGNNPSLPSRYNLREDNVATPIKNQGTDGICWAFATTTAMESYLKKTKNIDVEFSAKQLDYLTAEGTPYGNYATKIGIGAHAVGDGYNFLGAGLAFGTSSFTPVKESSFFAKMQANDSAKLSNYNSWYDYETDAKLLNTLSYNNLLDNVPSYYTNYYAEEMDWENIIGEKSGYLVSKYSGHYVPSYKTDDDKIVYIYDGVVESIKQHIYEKGAIYVGTYSPQNGSCTDQGKKTVVDLGSTTCGADGHAMAVIGWDDNYTYTNPVTHETETGAFILQNSWGKAGAMGLALEKMKTAGKLPYGDNIEYPFSDNKHNNYKSRLDASDYETVYLGYNMPSDSITFGFIDDMVENDYDEIYGLSNTINFKGNELANEQRDGDAVLKYDDIFKFSTGGEEKIIDAIAVGMVPPFSADSKISVSVGNGVKYVELGEVGFEDYTNGQKIINLQQPISVSGDFNLKINLCVIISGICEEYQLYQDVDGDGIIEEKTLVDGENYPDFDYKDDFYVATYLKDEVEDSVELSKLLRGTKEITWNSTTKEKYTIGDGKDLVFSIDYDYNYFDSIKVDNKALESKNYKVESGSTKITIFHGYLDTLTTGKHSIKVAFKDGESVDLEFNVAAQTNTGGGNQGGGTGNEGGNQGGGTDGANQGGGTGNEGGNQGEGTGTVGDIPTTSATEIDKKAAGSGDTGRFTAETKERAELTIIFTLPVAVVLFGIFRFSRLKK